MGVEFTLHERSALYGMLADNSDDVIFKSDGRGFIVTASPAIAGLGVNLPAMLIGPHLRDLVTPRFAPAIEADHHATFNGRGSGQWREYRGADGGWFEIRMRRLCDDRGRAYGVLSMMRSVTERKALEDRLFSAELTDPLTRLTNRVAFTAMLDYLIGNGAEGCIALFDLDHFMTLNMHYGHAAGDDLLRAFADLLGNLTRSEDILSRVGGERFAVLMPQIDPLSAREACEPVIETLAALGHGTIDFAITASCGVTRIATSVDQTVKRAELALFMAKAKGRSRVEIGVGEAAGSAFARSARHGNILAIPPEFA
ncbi:sensor domain-containing diguanylate cyclase [Novosphingobium sp.]|uniref:GGDEF domain-containing protein n=1 Tax=Novosphingobium sp. TaxID=1874826 RepID=UPI0025D9D26F|nr:sensor domain-containing diguanylate cyclase [Novosphingobium sp.]